MIRGQGHVAAALAGLLALLANGAAALDLPSNARRTSVDLVPLGMVEIPISGWADDQIDTLRREGVVDIATWQIPTPGLTPLQIIQPLRAQLEGEGFEMLFECQDRACGGFDFRYALDLVPGPAMQVDLGSFHYLAAERPSAAGPETLFLLASRSGQRGFLQQTRVLPADSAPGAAGSQRPAARGNTTAVPRGTSPASTETANSIGERLAEDGHVVLAGLSFETGSSRLAEGDFASLDALAAFLQATPGARIVLVGHTDAEGALEANIALSRKRAAAVRERLVARHGIAPGRIGAEGVGYLAPLASNASEEGRTINRRVEVILTGTDEP